MHRFEIMTASLVGFFFGPLSLASAQFEGKSRAIKLHRRPRSFGST